MGLFSFLFNEGDSLVDFIRENRKPTEQYISGPETCQLKVTGCWAYETECGHAWNSSYKDHLLWQFCPFCGRKIVEVTK
jgi:hypothetical protein